MPITYISDHDWEKHTTFDIENLFGTNSENDDINNYCTISTIHVPSNYDMFTNEHTLEDSYSIAYDDYNDEYDIFSPPTIEEKTRYDYNMPPIFDDYGDENNYFVEFAPTTITKNDYVHVGSFNSFMHMAHDKHFYVIVILLILFMMLLKVIMREGNMVLCISIILNFPSLC
jgi:hypothetical protein